MNDLANMNSLVLEDDSFQRAVLVAALKKLGIGTVIEAHDGFSGLDALRAQPSGFDLVLCDIQMDGMDGLEFIRNAAKKGIGGLIVCSALDDALLASVEWMARAFSIPLLGILHKPLNLKELARLLDQTKSDFSTHSEIFTHKPGAAGADDEAVEEIQMALDTSQFVPFFQPKVCLRTGDLVGAEILARWEHPARGILAPVHFIDVMEAHGQIEPLTHQLLEKAGYHARRWLDAGLRVPLALNVSPLTLEQEGSAARLLATAVKSRFPTELLTVEITETAFANDVKAMLENVVRLRMHQCGVSVDDFGTGYSSLQQLSRIPVTELKIDRSFVRRLPQYDKGRAIIESMIDLARKMKLKTVAEGIETQAQLDCLLEMGCELGQGYLYAKPLDAYAFEEWARRRQIIDAEAA